VFLDQRIDEPQGNGVGVPRRDGGDLDGGDLDSAAGGGTGAGQD
jgi:hypothetical protein